MKHCKACGKVLIRWPKEYPSHYAQRKCCDVKCARSLRHGGMPPGYVMPKKQVPCVGGCGTMLLRAHHYATAVCAECEKKTRQARQTRSHDKRREEARRYRILMALSPYGTWEELREAIRIRQRSNAANYDLAIERKRTHA